MSDPTKLFFEELAQRDIEPLVAKYTGRVRFEIVEGSRTERWLVEFDHGRITVSGNGGVAACTFRTDKSQFDRLAGGEENVMAAVLRGAVECTGDVELLLAAQRLFPGPPRAGTRSRDGRST